MFDAGKTRMIRLPYGEKNCDDILSRLHLISERKGQTYRQTDGQKEGQTDRFAMVKKIEGLFIRFDMIHERDRRTDTARRHRPHLCTASRGKNRNHSAM